MYKYLSRNYKDKVTAGNKAKTDNELIMQQMGLVNVGLRESVSRSAAAHFLRTLAGVLAAPLRLTRGDVLVLQYPLKKYFAFVCRAAHARGARVVVIMHDLGSFRRKALTPRQEIRRLDHADYIIADNPTMRRWLEDNGCRAMTGTLGVWDYLSASRPPLRTPPADGRYTVVFAGALNMRKNSFIYDWAASACGYGIRIYGKMEDGRPELLEGKADYRGYVGSDELIATARGDFGLVWDGGSLDACTGPWGEYLKINTPHKTSLYLRCGLPLIIWSGAAMAGFVRDNGIGLCVDSLRSLDDALAAVTPDDYRRMADNVAIVSRRIASGRYLKTALEKAFSLIHNA